MTTIKEFKELEVLATPIPWKKEFTTISGFNGSYITRDVSNGEKYVCRMDGSTHAALQQKHNLDFIVASRNLAPELIRVLELAEDALSQWVSHTGGECDPVKERVTEQALSEIRKLKGE